LYRRRDHLSGATEDAIPDAVKHTTEFQPWLENRPAFRQDYVLSR
jgi:hypothetical protein